MSARYVDLRPFPVTDTRYVPTGATGAVTFLAEENVLEGDASLVAVVSHLLFVPRYFTN